MKSVVAVIVLTIGISQASMNYAIASVPYQVTTTELPAKTVTKRGLVLAESKIPRVPKPKLFRSNPLRKHQILNGTDPSNAVDDEDYIFARNRNKIEVKKIEPKDDELPEHVRWRLFLARQLALAKYREVHG